MSQPYRDYQPFPQIEDPVRTAQARVLNKIADGIDALTDKLTSDATFDSFSYEQGLEALRAMYMTVMAAEQASKADGG